MSITEYEILQEKIKENKERNARALAERDALAEKQRIKEEIEERGDKFERIALCVGYSFIIAERINLRHVSYMTTDQYVKLDGVEFRLHKGATFADSQKVDELIDNRGYNEYNINEYKI